MNFLQSHPLFVVLLMAVVAPLLNELPLRFRLPVVVLEILLGAAVGPHVLGWVEPNEVLRHLARYGLAFLIFLSGMEIDFAKLRGRPLQRGAVGWLLSIVLALVLTGALQAVGFLHESLLVAVALSTTTMGMLLPILHESGEVDSKLGRCAVAAAAAGEFAPIVLFSLIVTGGASAATRSGLLATFVLIAIATVSIAARLRPPKVVEILSRTMHGASQLPVRAAILLLATLWVLADELGLDILLGAFTAGIVVGLVAPDDDPRFRERLHALGFGFMIPIFFVMSGVTLDLPALFASASGLVRVPIFLGLLLLVRGLPALLYRDLSGRERTVLALFSATTLPLVVAIAEVGKTTGQVLPENAAALVGAAILSVLIFPLLATSLRAR